MQVICLSNMPYIDFGDGSPLDKPLIALTIGKRYRALAEGKWIRVWDDFGEYYLYPPEMFEMVGETPTA
jgi:hypothetical protein